MLHYGRYQREDDCRKSLIPPLRASISPIKGPLYGAGWGQITPGVSRLVEGVYNLSSIDIIECNNVLCFVLLFGVQPHYRLYT